MRRSLGRRGWKKGKHFTQGFGGYVNGLDLCPERSRKPLREFKQRANVNRCAFEIRGGETFSFVILCQDCFGYSGSFWVPYKF